MRRAFCVVLVAAGLLAGPARAQFLSVGEFDFSITETMYVEWHRDHTKGSGANATTFDYADIKNRLNLSARSSWLHAGLRLDAAGFFGPDSGVEGEQFDEEFDNDLRVEKIFARMRFSRLSIEVGDLYGCLGKGIALCVKKVDELSTDTTLRGLKVEYAGRVVSATVLGGLSNIVNVGDLIEQTIPDPNDLVAGAEVRAWLADTVRVSAHGSIVLDGRDVPDGLKTGLGFFDPADEEERFARRELLVIVGPTVTVPDLFGFGSLFAEYDAVLNTFGGEEPPEDSDLLVGQTVYANFIANVDIVHLLAEVKWYESYLKVGSEEDMLPVQFVEDSTGQDQLIYYGASPPLEDENLLSRNDRPFDVVGGRLRADVEVRPIHGVAYVSYAHFVDTTGGPERPDDYLVQHVIGGWEQRVDRYSITANVSGGWRTEDYEFTKTDMYHFEGDVQFPIWGPHALELQGRREAYSRPAQGVDYSIARTSATYSFAPWLAVSYTYEYSREPGALASARGHFHSGELVYRFLSGSYARVFVGSSRGGLKCAGGMCRTFPPFEGVKGELTLRF